MSQFYWIRFDEYNVNVLLKSSVSMHFFPHRNLETISLFNLYFWKDFLLKKLLYIASSCSRQVTQIMNGIMNSWLSWCLMQFLSWQVRTPFKGLQQASHDKKYSPASLHAASFFLMLEHTTKIADHPYVKVP